MGQMQQNFGQNQYLKVITHQPIPVAQILMPFGSFSKIRLFMCFIGIDEKLSTTRWR